MTEFQTQHSAGELSMPRLHQAHISRRIRESVGASQPVQFVHHTSEMVAPVSWDVTSAPSVAFSGALDILDHCPRHGEGIRFAFMADSQPDPYCGRRIVYDDCGGLERPLRGSSGRQQQHVQD